MLSQALCIINLSQIIQYAQERDGFSLANREAVDVETIQVV